MKRVSASPILLAAVVFTGCAHPRADRADRADRDELLGIADMLFDAIETKNTDEIARDVVPGGAFVSVTRGPEGSVVRHFTLADWLESLPERPGSMREVFTEEPLIVADENVAALWSSYAFEVDGRPSHTGTDVFTFVRTSEGWKLTGGVYSVIPAGGDR